MPHMRLPASIAVLRAALVLSAGFAFVASDWSIVPAPPTGQNGNLPGVSAVPDSGTSAARHRERCRHRTPRGHGPHRSSRHQPSRRAHAIDDHNALADGESRHVERHRADDRRWPGCGQSSVLTSVPANPGAAIVWAAGHSGLSGPSSPLVPGNGQGTRGAG